jgi:hypothetical protein
MEDRMVCYYIRVTESTIREAIENGASSIKDIQEMTGACTGNDCKGLNPRGVCCSDDILMILGQESESVCNCCE